ncbi:MAG: BREX-1 system adenine-specific DNA-methyltransferase PglX [Clostridiales bacterium]|nr:BREX-1 system adenine-specific DNA-methyltransferase PglX [Clostridiales bacterium]
MNKTAIKNFAIWARNKLIADISYRAGLMGITENGIAEPLPQSTGRTEFYDIGTAEPYSISDHQVAQRGQLVEAIRHKEQDTDYKTAYNYIMEEVAYTWFNRLIAVRFMEVNDYLPSHIRVLSSETGKLEPDLVTTPFDADLSFTAQEEANIIEMKQDNKLDEMFRVLFIKQCNALNEILSALFEVTGHYTELLLNLSVIDQDGVVWHLVHDIDEADFDVECGGQVEIIGWLYQYYNTEPKDETFSLLKKNVKVTKERIPSATQLFTPDWIVRYMVENSLGRLWLEGHPNDNLKSGWKYYLDEAEQEPDVQEQLEEIRQEYRTLNPEDIRVIDPCMGSGHILVYAFDVLMQIYESQGYTQRDAAQSILQHNLYGLDIDERAAQLAYFAVMMKARQYDRRILSRGIQPHVYAIVESNGLSRLWSKDNKEMRKLFDVMRDAKDFGSILTVPVLNFNDLRQYVKNKVEEIDQFDMESNNLQEQLPQMLALVDVAEVLAGKYHVVATNPPYMGGSNMSPSLLSYVKENHNSTKGDLYAVFMEHNLNLLKRGGYEAMVTQHTWMFITSFEAFREKILNYNIVNMVHHGSRAFEGDVGTIVQTVSFVIRNINLSNYFGKYVSLLNYASSNNKMQALMNRYAPIYEQKNSAFECVPGKNIAYWLDSKLLNAFTYDKIETLAISDGQTKTGDNDKFLRRLWEVDSHKIGKGNKWVYIAKGGSFRKWYGNIDTLIDWSDSARRHYKADHVARIAPEYIWFRHGFVFNHIAESSKFAVREIDENTLFETAAPAIFINDEKKLLYIMGYLNTWIAREIIIAFNPTFNTNVRDITAQPIKWGTEEDVQYIDELVSDCINVCKRDWDSFETSLDFRRHPLIATGKISDAFRRWDTVCDERNSLLMKKEKQINDFFTSLYGLQSTSMDSSISFAELYKVNKRSDVVSLISYAVGCMFGRYSLDKDGLIYAGGDWDNGNYCSFIPDSDNVIPITDEEYLEDDIVSRLCQWLKVVYGEDTLEENLDFIASALGNKGKTSREIIRNYFLKDFFKDHCKIYQKRPIYWLFDSGRQNGFKALIYLHRYNADTIGNLRVDYLHRMQRVYESEMNRMQDTIDHSGNAREVAQATKRKEKLQKQLKECREYDEKISHLALSRIELDLDDGVKVNYEKVQTARDGKKYPVLAKI